MADIFDKYKLLGPWNISLGEEFLKACEAELKRLQEEIDAGGGGGGVTVIDNLNSTSATSALSANQGRILNNTKFDKTGGAISGDVTVNGLLELGENGKLLEFKTINGTLYNLPLAFVAVYENITDRFGNIIPIYPQSELANIHIPCNLSHANNPVTGKYIAYDVGAWALDETGYPALPKQILATFTEGVLNLDAKYFTPVDNGSGGLRLDGITASEVQYEYYRYTLGLTSLQTNKSGVIGKTILSFTVDSGQTVFQYRFGIADYASGTLNVYRALISATSAGISTPVEVVFTLVLSDIVTLSQLPLQLQSPADDTSVIRTTTDVQLNAHKLTLTGNQYVESDINIIVPSADPSHAGAYPADHYNRVQNLPVNTNTVLASKADLVGGIVPINQLPAFASVPIYGTATGLDENANPPTATGFNDTNGTPVTPVEGTFYFGTVSNLTFLYNASQGLFVAQGSGPQLGETSTTAYRGDRGLMAYNHSQITNGDPHGTIAQASFRTVGGTDIRGTGNIAFPTIPSTLPNPNALQFTGGSTASYDGSTPQSVAIPTVLPTPNALTITNNNAIPSGGSFNGSNALSVNIPTVPQYRVKALHTTAVSLTNGTAVTLATTATSLASQNNARITAHFTFAPDSATIVLAGLLNTLNISVRCEFLVNGVVIDEKYDTVQRTGTNQSRTFETVQNLTIGQVVSVRFTPTFSSGSCSIPASTSANFITIM